uniref:Dehydrogenase E1 component domain-containing protein n=1 Tax=Panagrolaimus davidi TaxID=227884 RepID=A0A914PJX5_9BILA
MDILSVREATKFVKEYCNAGKGPRMVELATYRYSGHSMSDPGTTYRSRDEIQEVRKTRDPITGFKDKIIMAELATEDELKEIDKSVRKKVDEAVQIAAADQVLPDEALYIDLYHNTKAQLIRGITIDECITQPFVNSAELLKSLGRQSKAH